MKASKLIEILDEYITQYGDDNIYSETTESSASINCKQIAIYLNENEIKIYGDGGKLFKEIKKEE